MAWDSGLPPASCHAHLADVTVETSEPAGLLIIADPTKRMHWSMGYLLRPFRRTWLASSCEDERYDAHSSSSLTNCRIQLAYEA